jgi:hypothetical protein
VNAISATGVDGAISLPTDLAELTRVVNQVGAALVVLDPLLSRLDSGLDSHKDSEVRRALEPLASLADSTGACVLGLIHVNKSSSSDALTLLMGSRAFAAVARAVLFVTADPDDENVRLLGQPKNNLGRTDNLPTLTFRIAGVKVAETPAGEVWTGKLEWLGESRRSIRDAIDETSMKTGDRTAATEAADWLQDFLRDQPEGYCDSVTIKREGGGAGHSVDALKRARHKLGVTCQSLGFPRKTHWQLPASQSERPWRVCPTAPTAPTAPTEGEA